MGKAKSLDGWLTAKEAAQTHGCHRNALYQAIKAGRVQLAHKRFGNRMVAVFSPEDVAKIKGQS